jgi:hypothetical protein
VSDDLIPVNDRQRLRAAYYERSLRLLKAGIIDCSMDADIADGMTVDEHIKKVLREEGVLRCGPR